MKSIVEFLDPNYDPVGCCFSLVFMVIVVHLLVIYFCFCDLCFYCFWFYGMEGLFLYFSFFYFLILQLVAIGLISRLVAPWEFRMGWLKAEN